MQCYKPRCDNEADFTDLSQPQCVKHFFTWAFAEWRELESDELEAANIARSITVPKMVEAGYDREEALGLTADWVRGQFPGWELTRENEEVPA